MSARSAPRTLAAALGTVAALVGVASAPGLASAAPAGDPCPGGDRLDLPPGSQARTMVCLINRERAAHGLGQLSANVRLARSAAAKDAAILRCGEFSHTPCGADFLTTFRRAGYRGSGVGENIAWGTGSLGTPAAIHRAWMRSPGHRRNILGREWAEVGVAVRPGVRFQGYSGAALWTAQYGSG